jgi:EpsI family protein
MEKMTTRCLIVIALMAIGGAVVNLIGYDKFNRSAEGLRAIDGIPMDFGQWKGEDIPLEESIFNILETRAIINRLYHSGDNRSVFLSIVYYTETKVDFHAPEACLGGEGIKVKKETRKIMLDTRHGPMPLKINRLIQNDALQKQLVYYFYKAGDFLGESYILLRINMAMNKFGTRKKSGALIRVSTPIEGDSMKQSEKALNGFLGELYPYIRDHL